MKKLTLGLTAVCLMIAFQNCSNGASFQSAGELVAKADGIDVNGDGVIDGVDTNGDGIIDDDINTGDGGNGPSASPTPPPTTPPVYMPPGTRPPGTRPPVTRPPAHGDDEDCDKDERAMDDPGQSEHANESKETSALQYVCVLQGSGKSLKVGIVSGSFAGKKGTPRDVCMTENACLNILSKKFDVKSAEKRGFCPNKNPHVIPMTDAEIQASLAESALVKSLNDR